MTDHSDRMNDGDGIEGFSAVEDDFIDGFFDVGFGETDDAGQDTDGETVNVSETAGSAGASADVETGGEDETGTLPEMQADPQTEILPAIPEIDDEIPGIDDIIDDTEDDTSANAGYDAGKAASDGDRVISGPASADPDDTEKAETAQKPESDDLRLDSITGKIELVDGKAGDNERAAAEAMRSAEAFAESEGESAAGDTAAIEQGVKSRSFFYRLLHAKKGDSLYVLHEIISYILLIALAFVAAILINIYVFRLSTVVGDSMNKTFTSGETVFLSRLPYIFGSPKRGDVIIFDHTGEARTFAKDWKDSIKSNAIVNLFKKNDTRSEDSHEFYIKRVIGVGGDVILFKDNKVYRAKAKELGGVYAEYYDIHEQLKKFPGDETLNERLIAVKSVLSETDPDLSKWEELSEPYVNSAEVPSYATWDGRLWVVGSGEVFVMGDNRNHSLDSRAIGVKPTNCILGKVLGNH